MKKKEIDLEVCNISRTDYRTFLSRTSPEISIARLFEGDDMIKNLGLRLDQDIPAMWAEDDYPVKWKEGSYIIVDFPLEQPLRVTLLECFTIYDLLEQIQSLYKDLYEQADESGYNKNVKLENLMIDKITICKSGDVLVYVSENFERGE